MNDDYIKQGIAFFMLSFGALKAHHTYADTLQQVEQLAKSHPIVQAVEVSNRQYKILSPSDRRAMGKSYRYQLTAKLKPMVEGMQDNLASRAMSAALKEAGAEKMSLSNRYGYILASTFEVPKLRIRGLHTAVSKNLQKITQRQASGKQKANITFYPVNDAGKRIGTLAVYRNPVQKKDQKLAKKAA